MQQTPQEAAQADWLSRFVGAIGQGVDVYREYRMLDPDYAYNVRRLEVETPDITGTGAVQSAGGTAAPTHGAGLDGRMLLWGLLGLGGVVLLARALD